MLHINSEWNWHENESGNQYLLLCKHFSFGRSKGFLKIQIMYKNILHFTTIVVSTIQKNLNWNGDDLYFRLSQKSVKKFES